MITQVRKRSLKQMAEQVATYYHLEMVTVLDKIVQSEDIILHYDHYDDTFDGLLVYDDDEDLWHIHINLDRGNSEDTVRGRFSLAHELAHFFIDEHRIAIKSGTVKPVGSRNDLSPQNQMEEEADYFAGCLLMPESLFRTVKTPKTFSLNTISLLSSVFRTSILSTAIKFTEVGNHEICVVLSEDGIVRWSSQNSDFPKWVHRFKRGQQLPFRTVASDYFLSSAMRETGIEKVDPNAWFEATFNADRDMYEQCHYSDIYGYVLSVLWFD